VADPACIRINVGHFLNFQVLARFMVLLNLVLPIFSILFIQTGDSSSLNICLGKGYLNFLPTQTQFCSADNPYKNCVCWVWLTVLSIGNKVPNKQISLNKAVG
jgi:hypothetical protein